MKIMKLEEFAKKHRKEILEWQKWWRKQSGKTIAEIDRASEPKLRKASEYKNNT